MWNNKQTNRLNPFEGRLEFLDQMRGIAIIGVILTHFTGITLNMRESAINILFSIFQVPVFFLVSGYLSMKANGEGRSVSEFVHRLFVILTPLIAWSAIETVAFSRPYDYYLTHNFAGLWFLWVLFQIVLVFGLLELLPIGKRGLLVDLVVYGGVYILLLVGDKVLPEMDSLNLHLLVNYSRYYIIGIFMRKYPIFRKILTNRQILPLLILAFCAQWWFFSRHITLLIFAGSLAGSLIVWILCESWNGIHNKATDLLTYLGRLTLPIYCIHWLYLPQQWSFNTSFMYGIGALTPQVVIASVGGVVILLLTLSTYYLLNLNEFLRIICFGKIPKSIMNRFLKR